MINSRYDKNCDLVSDKTLCIYKKNVKDLKCDPFPCGDQSSGSRVPHMCYCDRYYECKNGEKILVHCDKGWQFDYVLQKCILSEAHCYKNIHVNPPRGCIVNDGSSHDPSGTYPHENCNRYCSYNNGHWEIVTCREDSYYNTDIGRCDWPENIKHLGCDPFNCESRKDNATMPHECDCNIYYLCYKGSKYQKFCNEGDGFDFTLHKCVKYEDGHCYKKPSEKRPAEIEGCIGTCPSSVPNNRIRLPHEDCKKFCTCDSPNMYVNHCLKDLVYCDKLKTCTYQYRSQTCDRVRDMCASEGSFDEFPRSSVTFSEQTEEMIV
ncbi:hypothetical protein WH47_08917 [Habropoda laboriosa]|uniref:Chitin-binding type-2 domain-containing protein n=1 Tax=Habropoda laboriosa TaxID=597456 RepID=A0A0L7R6S0_9HYME|nr:hypothetical protein WH47_08917 [Habropoda laboriosa]